METNKWRLIKTEIDIVNNTIKPSSVIIEGEDNLREYWKSNSDIKGAGTSNNGYDKEGTPKYYIQSGVIKGTSKLVTIVQYEL